jgi:hypothetical protein
LIVTSFVNRDAVRAGSITAKVAIDLRRDVGPQPLGVAAEVVDDEQ